MEECSYVLWVCWCIRALLRYMAHMEIKKYNVLHHNNLTVIFNSNTQYDYIAVNSIIQTNLITTQIKGII